jgi:inosine-uridine nucleoside N-ribohydrolase
LKFATINRKAMLNRKALFRSLLFTLLLSASSVLAAEPVRLILDTDIGNDIDDTLALAMIHALQNRAEVHLLAVTITKDNRYAAPFVDLVNSFYGRPNIPIGVVHKGKTPDDSPMLKVPTGRRDATGHYVYPHRIENGSEAADATELLHRVLNEQPDHSVTIAQIGFSTNLARLLKTPGGRDLIERKVKILCLMAGNFEKPEPEYNVHIDSDSAKILFQDWPTPLVFSPFNVGLAITYPYESIQKDFGYTANHPIAEAYRTFTQKPEDRPNYDSTAVLQAIRPDRGYFDLSPPGRVTLGPKSVTVFTPDPQGKCRYLIVKPDRVAQIRELMAALVSEPPQRSPTAVASQRMTF